MSLLAPPMLDKSLGTCSTLLSPAPGLGKWQGWVLCMLAVFGKPWHCQCFTSCFWTPCQSVIPMSSWTPAITLIPHPKSLQSLFGAQRGAWGQTTIQCRGSGWQSPSGLVGLIFPDWVNTVPSTPWHPWSCIILQILHPFLSDQKENK